MRHNLDYWSVVWLSPRGRVIFLWWGAEIGFNPWILRPDSRWDTNLAYARTSSKVPYRHRWTRSPFPTGINCIPADLSIKAQQGRSHPSTAPSYPYDGMYHHSEMGQGANVLLRQKLYDKNRASFKVLSSLKLWKHPAYNKFSGVPSK